MINSEEINVDVDVGGQRRRIDGKKRREFAQQHSLNEIIPERFSEILVVDLMMNLELNGIDPSSVIQEIKRLESGGNGYTKAASQFKHAPLHPLWHQHYFSSHYVVQNIQNELKKNFNQIWNSSMGPEGSVIERKHISALVHNVVQGTIEARSDEGRITGEWLVFAKEPSGMVYLCMATHLAGDQEIYNKIAYCCERQFPFLEPFASNSDKQNLLV